AASVFCRYRVSVVIRPIEGHEPSDSSSPCPNQCRKGKQCCRVSSRLFPQPQGTRATTLFPSILLFGGFDGLPLHVVWRIRAASLEGRNVIDDIPWAGARRLACRWAGVGFAKVSLGVLTSRDSPVRVPRNTGRRPGVRAGSYVGTATAGMRPAAA